MAEPDEPGPMAAAELFFDRVERRLNGLPDGVRAAFRAELDAAAPYVTDRSGQIMARIHDAMVTYAGSSLDRLRAARRLADVDWRDLLVSTAPLTKIEKARIQAETWTATRAIPATCSVLIGGAPRGALRFVILADGSIRDVPFPALAHLDDAPDVPAEHPGYLAIGAYGLLETDGDDADFERRGVGRMWRPRHYETTPDQRLFQPRLRKGTVRDRPEAVDTAAVLGSRRHAHRWPEKGFVLYTSHEAAAFLPGVSIAEWHRAQRAQEPGSSG